MLFLFASLALSTLASKFASAPLVLGSGSSSRAAILRDCGLKFEVRKPGIDEKAIRHDSAKELVLALGLAKAAALRDDPDLAARGALLITGDQVVVADGGRILEKPEDEAEARAFIDSYGRDPPRTVGSLVVTDAASGQQWSAVDEACVHFSPIPDDVVDQLLEEGDVYYCAGGLMVEHPLVQPYVQRMDGSMDSIMGLCVATLEKLLDEAIAARSCSRPPPPPSPPPPSRSPPVRMGLTDLFDQTPPDERYNAVLLTMLAPAKGSGGQTVERRKQALPNALNLIDEMTTNRLRLSPNVLISLVDASLDAGEAELSAALLSARANGACRSFGGRRWAPPERPPASALASLPPLPQDDRDAEAAGAAAAGLLATGAAAVAHPPAALAFGGQLAALAADRYTNKGAFADLLGRSFGRLVDRDLNKECAVESASFIVGLLLGLPCCASTPSAQAPIEMLRDGKALERALGGGTELPRLIDRILIWLVAPAALEARLRNKPLSLAPSPSIALDFLQAARRREALTGVDVQQGGWTPREDDARVRWAFAQAAAMLQKCDGVRVRLEQRMIEGCSFGGCVQLVEEQLGGLEEAAATEAAAARAVDAAEVSFMEATVAALEAKVAGLRKAKDRRLPPSAE